MWRAPGRKRSSRSRACPGPARCPTHRPPRSTARRPPAGPAGAWPTASNTTRTAVKQPLLGRSAVADTTAAWAASYRDLALAGSLGGGHRPVVLHPERFVEYLTATYGHDRLPGGAPGRVRVAGPPGVSGPAPGEPPLPCRSWSPQIVTSSPGRPLMPTAAWLR